MPLIALDALQVREIFPGFRARIVHSERTSHSWVEIDSGARFPEHHHPHEQIVNVLEGELELVVRGAVHRLVPGQVFVIPPDVPHHGRAITACRVLDVFAPVRDDYRTVSDTVPGSAYGEEDHANRNS
ncbi:MAG: cupin domain-containing protein [Vicinamibacterales bacterium]